MALGAAYLGAKKMTDALVSYRNAGAKAAVMTQAGDSVGPKLALQAKLAEGAALIADGKYADAAFVYRQAVELAGQAKDDLMTMESWRMAAYCHETLQQPEAAWECGHKALEAAERLAPEVRANSTLPFVGQGLLRAGKKFGSEAEKSVRDRMIQLAGADWEMKAKV